MYLHFNSDLFQSLPFKDKNNLIFTYPFSLYQRDSVVFRVHSMNKQEMFQFLTFQKAISKENVRQQYYGPQYEEVLKVKVCAISPLNRNVCKSDVLFHPVIL